MESNLRLDWNETYPMFRKLSVALKRGDRAMVFKMVAVVTRVVSLSLLSSWM